MLAPLHQIWLESGLISGLVAEVHHVEVLVDGPLDQVDLFLHLDCDREPRLFQHLLGQDRDPKGRGVVGRHQREGGVASGGLELVDVGLGRCGVVFGKPVVLQVAEDLAGERSAGQFGKPKFDISLSFSRSIACAAATRVACSLKGPRVVLSMKYAVSVYSSLTIMLAARSELKRVRLRAMSADALECMTSISPLRSAATRLPSLEMGRKSIEST